MNWHDTPREDRVSLLRNWAEIEGLSSTQIAEKFKDGVTRNTIIGLCDREKITLSGKPGRQTPKTKKADTRGPVRTYVVQPAEALPSIPNDPPLAGSAPAPLISTTGCRWPVEGGFCNHRIHSKSYCETHHAKAYRPAHAVHPLLERLATKGPQTPRTFEGCQKYTSLVRERLVMFRRGPSGLCTYYLTDAGRAML